MPFTDQALYRRRFIAKPREFAGAAPKENGKGLAMKAYEIDFETGMSIRQVEQVLRRSAERRPGVLKLRYDVDFHEPEYGQVDNDPDVLHFVELVARITKKAPGWVSSLPGGAQGGLAVGLSAVEGDRTQGLVTAAGTRVVAKDALKMLRALVGEIRSQDAQAQFSDERAGRL